MLKPKIASASLILLLVTLACNTLNAIPQPTPTWEVIAEPTSPPTKSTTPLSEADVPRVSLEKAYVAYNAGAAIFVDVRSKQTYDASHIPGALSIQLGEFETNASNLDLPKNAWIITYCT